MPVQLARHSTTKEAVSMIFAILVTLWLVVLTLVVMKEQAKLRVVRNDLLLLTNYIKERNEP